MFKILSMFFDILGRPLWPIYLHYMRKDGLVSNEYGKCTFVYDEAHRKLLQESMLRLQVHHSEMAKAIKGNKRLGFVFQRDFPVFGRGGNLKYIIYKNTINHGTDGVISILGYAYFVASRQQRSKSYLTKLFIYYTQRSSINKEWIDWMKDAGVNQVLLEYYEQTMN